MRTTVLTVSLLALSACSEQPAKPTERAESAPTPAPAPTLPPSPPSAAPTQQDFALTCTNPVRLGDTVAAVRKQFGTDARIETLTGAEGIEYQAVVLWGEDPRRRLVLPFDADRPRPTVGAADIGSPQSQWRVHGLGLGDSLGKVIAANGKPFRLYGFSWDYGGNVTSWSGGKLDKDGTCGVSLRLGPGRYAEGDYAMGEAEFAADDAKVAAAQPVIDSLGVIAAD